MTPMAGGRSAHKDMSRSETASDCLPKTQLSAKPQGIMG